MTIKQTHHPVLPNALAGAGLLVIGLALAQVSCGDDDDNSPPGETCLTGYCVARSNGASAGVTRPVICGDTYCTSASLICAVTLHVSSAASAGGDGSSGSPFADLGSAAKVAKDGDCVLVAKGSYLGAEFTGGVRILGAGASLVSLKPATGATKTLTLEGGSGGVVRGLSISGAAVGLYISKTSSLLMQQVRIKDSTGVGLYATGATNLSVENVAIAEVKPETSGSSVGAAMGVVLLEKSRVKLRGVLLDSNGQLGLLAKDASVDMASSLVLRNGTGGGAGSGGIMISCNDRKVADCAGTLASSITSVDFLENKGVGLLAAAAKLEMSNILVSKTKLGGGAARGVSIHGLGMSSMSVSLKSSTVSDGEGQGIVVDGASGVGDDPDPIFLTVDSCMVAGNKDRGVWLQRLGATKGSISLLKNTFSGNWLMGMGGVQIKGVLMDGGEVSGTKKTAIMVGGASLEMGDGIQVMDQSSMQVKGVKFSNNERLSLLFDGSSGQVTSNTFASSTGAKALVFQNGSEKSVTASGNKDGVGAEIKGSIPTTPFGLNKAILGSPAIPATP